MQIQDIPRAYIRFTLGAARLPVAAAEIVFHRNGDDEWPPALAFDRFDATLRQVAGSLLRDDVLVEEGRLSEARIARLREAMALEATAHRLARDADDRLQRRREHDEERLDDVEQETNERLQAVEEDKERRKREAEKRARDQERRAREKAAAEKNAKAKKERATRSAQLSREKAALTREQKATKAKRGVLAVDHELESAKARRRNGGSR